jgi:type IV secretory pathway VirB10-like protein
MEVLPRLKTVIREAAAPIVSQPIKPVASTPSASDATDEAPLMESRGFFRDNIVVIVIFATIVIMLILLILWLVSTSDKSSKKPKKSETNKTIEEEPVDEDELAKYANLIPKKTEEYGGADPFAPSPVAAPQSPVQPSPKKKVTINDSVQSITLKDIDKVASQYAADKQAADKFAADKFDVMSKVPEQNIDAQIDLELSKVAAMRDREIEQRSSKSHHKLKKIFKNIAEIKNEGYDSEKVLECCRGEAPEYKKYVWRFREEDEITGLD